MNLQRHLSVERCDARPKQASNFGRLLAIILMGTLITHSQLHAANQAERFANQRIEFRPAKRVKTPKPAASKKVVDADAGQVQTRKTSSTASGTKRRPSNIARAASGQALRDLPPAPLDGSLVQGQVRQATYVEGYGVVGCGCEGPVCDCGEVACGVEAGCGFEPACGCDMNVGCSCGVQAGCGFEVGPGCGVEVGCGLEPVADCGCDACAGAPAADCYPLFLPILRVNWSRFDFFAGAMAFKGPMNFANVNGVGDDRNGSGSFGIYEGFNEGRSLKRWLGWDIAAQLGVRATQSNLSGAEFTGETRNQVFVTWGLFRRVDYGFQYGFVVDYLNEDWYFQGDLTQIRGELSWNTGRCHVFGYQFMASTGDDTSSTVVRDGSGAIVNGSVTFESTDQYRLFYRRTLNGSGAFDAFAGWTDRDDGLIGTTLNLPLRQKLGLQTGVTYLVPNGGSNEEESWNLSLGVVFRPGGIHGGGRYCRPMFDVADNGTFMMDRR